jgi:hypothetical protein
VLGLGPTAIPLPSLLLVALPGCTLLVTPDALGVAPP